MHTESQKVFDQILNVFDKCGVEYQKDDGYYLGAKCYQTTRNGLKLETHAEIDIDFDLIRFCTELDIKVPENKKVDMAVCIGEINIFQNHGIFEYDIVENIIAYRIVRAYNGCPLTDSYLIDMYYKTGEAVDKYYDLLIDFVEGKIGNEIIYRKIKERKNNVSEVSEEFTERANNVYRAITEQYKKAGHKVAGVEAVRMIYVQVEREGKTTGLIVHIDAAEQVINVRAPFSLEIKEEKKYDFAVASNIVTSTLFFGELLYSMHTNVISFCGSESFFDGCFSLEGFSDLVERTVTGSIIYSMQFDHLNKNIIEVSFFIP